MGANVSSEGTRMFGISISIIQGKNLSVRGRGMSDSYVYAICGGQEHKTNIVRGDCNPIWNDRADFMFDSRPEQSSLNYF